MREMDVYGGGVELRLYHNMPLKRVFFISALCFFPQPLSECVKLVLFDCKPGRQRMSAIFY